MRTRTRVVACLLLTAAFNVHAETRVALVIGNSTYQHAPLLPNPAHDAMDVAAALRKLGYAVELVSDASKPGMEAALGRFAGVTTGADQALIYYAGHGLEAGGVNYLLPVEARIESEATVPLEAVSLTTVMGIASRARHFGLVVLDACRDNPLANNLRRPDGTTRSASRGLAAVEPTGNLLVAYATRDGRVAADGKGRNSPYTAAILEALQVQGLEVRLFWGRVHDNVVSATHRAQEPFTYGALGGEALYLNPPAASDLPPSALVDPRAPELALWQSVQSLQSLDAYRVYLKAYPDGQFSVQAQLRIAALTRPAASSSSSAASASASSGSKPAAPSGLTISGHSAGEVFRDCQHVCPEMVVIPAGSFMMGSPDKGRYDDEGPQHLVHIGAFEVSKYPVTRGQWRLYANETGHRTIAGCGWIDPKKDWLNPGFPQDDTHPVVCTTWQDAQDYIAWLNKKSGQQFRLLTEAEYEYVNRAGTQTVYFWGDSDQDLAQHANNNGKGTTPVGSFPANLWGLFDTTGNVWTRTQDCWHKNYHGAPTEGSAWKTGCDSSTRVVRGGSWYSPSWTLRSANRYGVTVGYSTVGVRLARTLCAVSPDGRSSC
jgi:formylglycine-generating enzyme required for sulfatase activity